MSSSQLRAERTKYYAFREQVAQFASKLLQSYNIYFSAHKKIKDTYTLDGESADKGVIKFSYDSLKESYDLLINSTIPNINYKIDFLTSQIRAAEAEEEARRAQG